MLRSDTVNCLRIISKVELLRSSKQPVINEFDISAQLRRLLHLANRHRGWRQHRMSHNHLFDPLRTRLAQQQQIVLRRVVSSRHHQIVPSDHPDHVLRLRQQFPLARHRNERSPITRLHNLSPRIVSRHPNQFPKMSSSQRHLLHRNRIHPANAQIQVDPAKHLNPRNQLMHKVSDGSSRLIVVLQHNSAHPSTLRQLRQVDRINAPRHRIRSRMNMNINHSIQRFHLSLTSPRDQPNTNQHRNPHALHGQTATSQPFPHARAHRFITSVCRRRVELSGAFESFRLF